LGEVRQALEKNKGKMVGEGAVQWMFERKGAIGIPPQDKEKEELEMASIEAGADDLYWHKDGFLEIYTKPTELESVQKALEASGITSEEASLDWVPKERVSIEEKEQASANTLFEILDEEESVQDVYSNLS
jgi:transcriptional/translational regulatory protein YebC/TACO1